MSDVGVGVLFNRNRVTVAAYYGANVKDVLVIQITPMGACGDSAYVYTSDGITYSRDIPDVWELVDTLITERGATDDVRYMRLHAGTWAMRLWPPTSSYQFSSHTETREVPKVVYPKTVDDQIEYQRLVHDIVERAVDTDEAVAILMAEGVM